MNYSERRSDLVSHRQLICVYCVHASPGLTDTLCDCAVPVVCTVCLYHCSCTALNVVVLLAKDRKEATLGVAYVYVKGEDALIGRLRQTGKISAPSICCRYCLACAVQVRERGREVPEHLHFLQGMFINILSR